MNAYSRTLSLTGGKRGNGVVAPVRETGSSALDRRATWAAPDPSTMVLDPWGAPAAHAVIRTLHAPWAAPDPSMRVDLPAPLALAAVGVTNLVEPFHPIDVPDIGAAQRASFADPASVPVGRPLPPPTLADAAERLVSPAPAPVDRSGVRRRLAVGVAAAAGVACAAVAAAVALF